jgi:hypothetical protein
MLTFLADLGCVAAFGIVYCLLICLHTYAPALCEAIIAHLRNSSHSNPSAAKTTSNGRTSAAATKKLSTVSKSA